LERTLDQSLVYFLNRSRIHQNLFNKKPKINYSTIVENKKTHNQAKKKCDYRKAFSTEDGLKLEQLILGDLEDRILDQDPVDHLVAGGRGQRARVPKVLVELHGREQIAQSERVDQGSIAKTVNLFQVSHDRSQRLVVNLLLFQLDTNKHKVVPNSKSHSFEKN
jgi:hypothetical protein